MGQIVSVEMLQKQQREERLELIVEIDGDCWCGEFGGRGRNFCGVVLMIGDVGEDDGRQ